MAQARAVIALGCVFGPVPQPATVREAGTLDRCGPSFLEEELNRFDSSLDRVPETHPDLALARGLEDEARQQLSSGRLANAVASLRDVRRILITLERGRKRSSLSAPWDESVEALFDRVLARARAMTRPGSTLSRGG